MGGTLKLVPHEPEMNRFTGSAQVQGSQTVGGSASGSASVMVNLPVQTDVAAVRVVATRRHNGGYIDRVVVPDMPTADPTVNGSYFEGPRGDVKSVPASKVYKDVNSEDITQLRVSALIKPASGLTITPSVLYQKSKYGGEYSIDATPGDNAHYQPFDIAEPISSTLSLVSLKVNYELPDVTLTSVTAYAKQRMSQTQDTTEVGFEGIADTLGLTSYKSSQGGLGPISSTETNPTSQATQEIRLASKGQGPLQWIVGGYIGHFESTYHGRITAPEAAPLVGTTDYYGGDLGGSRTQYALFGNATYQFTPALRGTVGARAFRITDKFTGNDFGFFGSGQPADLTTGSNKGVNPMVNLAYTVTPDSMVYATASKGFREGSGQRGVPAAACATDLAALGRTDAPHHYNPDTVWNYEVGSKNRLFNRNMVFNVAVYQMNWDNVQKAIYLPTCGFVYTDNAAKAKVQGAEVELGARLSDTFQFEQSLGYTHARYSADNMASGTKKGDELDGVPTWNASSSLRYYKQISDDYSLLARLSAVYVGKYIDHSATVGQFGDYTMVNFRIGLDTDRWSGAVYVNNLTNKQARMGFQRSLSLSSPSTDRIVIDRPRTIGVELNYNW
jgi:outer membrane receptor protein involved in Fe transport